MPQAVNGMKYCGSPNCQQVNPQPTSNFHRHRINPDGLNSYCKDCRHIQRTSPEAREKDRRYPATEKSKARNKLYKQSERGKAAEKRWATSPRGQVIRRAYRTSEAGKLAIQREYAKNPLRFKAKTALAWAVRSGKIPRISTQICVYCERQAQQYHHYNGYEKDHWLDVVPLCISCHSAFRNQPVSRTGSPPVKSTHL